jgi:hypothetical protein
MDEYMHIPIIVITGKDILNSLVSPDKSCQTWENTGKICIVCADAYCTKDLTTCNP